MYYNIKNNMKSANNYQSPSSNMKVFQSPSQQYKNLMNNNYINGNIYQNNTKINKLKNQQKEKIIEGDLNFNEVKINNRATKHNQKVTHGKPRKSPVPVPKNYKPSNLFSYQKLFAKNNYLNNLKPQSAFPHQNNFVENDNNKIIKSNIVNNNFPSNKTYNTFNIFKKNLERNKSPLLKTGNKLNNNFNQKEGVVKSRYISKSPILGKGSIFNRYKMYGFGASTGTSISNNGSNNIAKDKQVKKKTPIKSNNIINKNIKKQSNNNQFNNIGNNNCNLMRYNKGQTLISGEIIQDSSNGPQFNMNINNKSINQVGNINNNNNKIANTKNNQNNKNNNINPIFNGQNFKIENNKLPQNINNNNNSDKNSNINNIQQNKENNNKNNLNNGNGIIKKEDKQHNQRSLSQGPIDLLKKNDKNSNQNEISNNIKQIEPKNKTIIKKIKELLPYTHVGFDGEEPKENNQDNYFIYKNFAGNKNYIYMSVCDGHGIEGHFVSEFIKEILPYDMSENLKTTNILTETEKTHRIITDTFLIANDKLVDNEEINSLFSGSTCVSVIFTPEKLIVPNIGDSRAVMGRLNKKTNEYIAINLSRDHKPTEKDEAKRILENDGRIQPFLEDGEFVGPQRVWIKDEEVPGLAMTRSFGDRVAATVGVMSEPEIKEFNFCEEDKFMIIASDGVWEFISSQECVNMIKDFYVKNDLKGCCEYLYQESSKRWLKEEEVIDDTTMILVFFE